MKKGERFIRCRGQRHDSRGAMVTEMQRTEAWFQGSMSDMTLVLHEMISVLHQTVSINAKGGYFLLRLIVIDVNP
jgi:hypothetical protein